MIAGEREVNPNLGLTQAEEEEMKGIEAIF